MDVTPENVAANPAVYGLEIVTDELKKDGNTYPDIRLFRVTDLDLFRESFRDALVIGALNGTSLKVSFQRIVRDYVCLSRDNLKNHAEQILRMAKFLCGERNRGESLPYVAVDGTRHATIEAARIASIESLKSTD